MLIYAKTGTKLIQETDYVCGEINGLMIEHRGDGWILQTTYHNGVRHGPTISYQFGDYIEYLTYNNGIRSGPCLHQDIMDDEVVLRDYGKCYGWYGSGARHYVLTYVGDNSTGIQKYWHENGMRHKEYTDVEGKRVGLYREWSEDGELIVSRQYTN
jgi:antitoxin component YwqK of YwqJK toxin-antitoxin module